MRLRNLLAAGAISLIVAWWASGAPGAIRGSAHDFSGEAWNHTGEICAPCHTPHHANTSVVDSPLWNHAVTQATFQVYQSSTIQATDISQPTGRSKLCLSCHDGTVALDSFGGRIGSSYIGARGNLGTDLSNDHPISFTYDDSLAARDGDLYPPSATNSGLGGTIGTDLLFNSKMECSSCHDVHNAAGVEHMLVKSNAGSAVCLTCHDK